MPTSQPHQAGPISDSLLALPISFWSQRNLIRRLVVREIAARYRGSVLGIAWALIGPIALLTVYTFVFTVIFQARWQAEIGNRGDFALNLFTGLIVFQFFSECITRAPRLLLENVSYITKIVFPLESLTWVAIGTAAFGVLMNLVVLLLAHLFLAGWPPATAFLFPLVMLPLLLITAGITWFLAATGVYLRDLGQLVSVVLPILLFGSAVFYPLQAVPEPYRGWIALNPLVPIIEMARETLLEGTIPALSGYVVLTVLGLLLSLLGLTWFRLTKRGFADVV